MPLLPGPRLPEKSTTPPLPTVNCAVPPLLLPRNSVLPPLLVVMMASPAVAAFWKFQSAAAATADIERLCVPGMVVDADAAQVSDPPLLMLKV